MKYLWSMYPTHIFMGIGTSIGVIAGDLDPPYPRNFGNRVAGSIVLGCTGFGIGVLWPIILPAVIVSGIVKCTIGDEPDYVGIKKVIISHPTQEEKR